MKKYKKYQIGDEVRRPEAKMREFSGNIPKKDILAFLLSPEGQQLMDQYKKAGYKISADDNAVTATRPTGNYELPLGIKAFNTAAQFTTGLANEITDVKNRRNERKQYLEALQPRNYESYSEEGLNPLPIYTKYGGGYHMGGEPHDEMMEVPKGYHMMPDGSLMSDAEMYAYGGYPEMKSGGKWIQKAINPKHKGYCTPMTKSTCTPRRKALAMRFKHGDLSKKQTGGTYKTQAEILAANAEAKAFAARHSLGKGINPEDAYVAKKVGDPVLQYFDELGRPYVAPKTITSKYKFSVPDEVSINDIYKTREGTFMYDDPHTGNATAIDPSVLNLPRFRKSKEEVAKDLMARMPYGGGPLTSSGAKEILRDGKVHGKKLTPAQKRYFGFIAGGGKPKKETGGELPCAECGGGYYKGGLTVGDELDITPEQVERLKAMGYDFEIPQAMHGIDTQGNEFTILI